MAYFDANGCKYTMYHVMGHLKAGSTEAAYTSYWFAMDGALPFDVCIQHVTAIKAAMPDPSARNVPIDTNWATLANCLADHSNPSQKIYAIKELRRVTGWGLKEAKDAVESFMKEVTAFRR